MRTLLVGAVAIVAGLSGLLAGAPAPAAPQSDLDAFMKKVLAKRDDNWKKLQQYVLEEHEKIDVRGPVGVPVWGERRDYSWFIREGFFIRSPLKVNGVTISEAERRKAEDEYLKMAQQRERNRARGGRPGGEGRGQGVPVDPETTQGVESLLRQSRQPEFMDSAYFLRFKFEEGKYALVGRETFQNLPVYKIEYYPARLFSHDQDKAQRQTQAGRETRQAQTGAAYEQAMNKVSLVTIWVEPTSSQIVKYTFDNINMDFLPAAWLLRVTDLKASMTMSQPFKEKQDVWLPRDVDIFAGGTLAIGSFDGRYHIDYLNYQEAKVTSRIKDPGRGSR